MEEEKTDTPLLTALADFYWRVRRGRELGAFGRRNQHEALTAATLQLEGAFHPAGEQVATATADQGPFVGTLSG